MEGDNVYYGIVLRSWCILVHRVTFSLGASPIDIDPAAKQRQELRD